MTLQTQLLGVHVLALLVLAAGSLAGSSTVAAVGFAAVFLTLASLFVAMTGALVDGLRRRPESVLASERTRVR